MEERQPYTNGEDTTSVEVDGSPPPYSRNSNEASAPPDYPPNRSATIDTLSPPPAYCRTESPCSPAEQRAPAPQPARQQRRPPPQGNRRPPAPNERRAPARQQRQAPQQRERRPPERTERRAPVRRQHQSPELLDHRLLQQLVAVSHDAPVRTNFNVVPFVPEGREVYVHAPQPVVQTPYVPPQLIASRPALDDQIFEEGLWNPVILAYQAIGGLTLLRILTGMAVLGVSVYTITTLQPTRLIFIAVVFNITVSAVTTLGMCQDWCLLKPRSMEKARPHTSWIVRHSLYTMLWAAASIFVMILFVDLRRALGVANVRDVAHVRELYKYTGVVGGLGLLALCICVVQWFGIYRVLTKQYRSYDIARAYTALAK